MRMSRLFLVALFFISVGTAFVMMKRLPEAFAVTSTDGRVAVEGKGIGEQTIIIDRLDDAAVPLSAVVGPMYTVSPSSIFFSSLVTLSMRYDDLSLSEADVYRAQIGYFDEGLGLWYPVETDRDVTEGVLKTSLNHFSRWAILVLDPIARPDLSREMQALIDAPPPGTIGYEVFVSYADQPGDFVLLKGLGKTGGCGGRFRSGDSTQMTSAEQNFSDTLTYRVQVRWQIGEGCFDNNPIE